MERVEFFRGRVADSIFAAAGSVFKKSSGIGDRRLTIGVFLKVEVGVEGLPVWCGEDTER